MEKRKTIFLIFLIVAITLILGISNKVFAAETTKVYLSDNKITVNENDISTDTTSDIYLSENMDNGGLSEEAKEANIEVKNVINIRTSGIYEFTGSLSDGQIAINTNEITGDVVILLNNVDITCKNAPAIFAYNVQTKSEKCNVIIKTAKDSKNYVYGGQIKQSVEGWIDQDKILYNIEKNYNDEGKYFERYKYDGAISADISLTFEGEGTLTIASKREGIEVKRDITINSGNYIINSTEDGMNAAQDNESIITINGGTILVNTSKDGEQGDGIDSNGYMYINGGTLYIFANPVSEDSGLDSDLGIYINGGQIVATGNMYDEIKEDSKQNQISLQFNKKIAEGELITLVDEKDNPIIAFETDREYKIITFSNANLESKTYTVYKGGKIEGTKTNGLYTEITAYTKGEKIEASIITGRIGMFDRNFNQEARKINWYIISALGVSIVVCFVISIILIKKNKGKVWILVLGILIGIAATIIVTMLCDNRLTKQNAPTGNLDIEAMKQERPIDMNDIKMPQDMPNQGNMNNQETPPEKPTI